MRDLVSALRAMVAIVVLALLAVAGAGTLGATGQPDKLVLLSTTDVKGKTSPCG